MDEPTPEQWQRVVDNTGLVWFHLNRCRMTEAEREEAFADGCLGLLRAAQKFDPDLGYTFATYSMFWIRQAVGRGRLERAGRNARYADAKGVDYSAPVSLDMLVGEDETMTLGDTVADERPLPDDRSVAAIRLAAVYAAMLASARDVLDVAIIDGLKDEHGWQRRVAEREGVTSEAVRRRWARLRQAAVAADEGVGVIGGSFDETEVRRAMLDDDTMVDPFEAPATRELRARRAERAAAGDTGDS